MDLAYLGLFLLIVETENTTLGDWYLQAVPRLQLVSLRGIGGCGLSGTHLDPSQYGRLDGIPTLTLYVVSGSTFRLPLRHGCHIFTLERWLKSPPI